MGQPVLCGDMDFILQVRCLSCLREKALPVEVPLDGGPLDLDDFLAAHPLGTLRYRCDGCDGVTAKVVGVRRAR